MRKIPKRIAKERILRKRLLSVLKSRNAESNRLQNNVNNLDQIAAPFTTFQENKKKLIKADQRNPDRQADSRLQSKYIS